MKTLLFFCLVFIFLITFHSCNQPEPEKEFIFESLPDTAPASNTSPKTLSAFIAFNNAPSCTRIPTQAEVNNGQWSYTDHFYSASQALKMGIPVVNFNGSHNLKVYVKDYRRIAPCTSTDSVTVLYGQIIRTVIEIENYDASVGVDLASIAANGTLKRNSQHFYFYKDGFFNQKIDSIIVSVQGKEFDVQNFHLFQNVMGDVINLLRKPGTTFSPSRIGIQEKVNDELENISKSPIIAYSLSSICNGYSCNRTKNKFINNNKALDIVENTYRTMECSIDDEKPTDEAKTEAKRLLQGIKIKN